MPAPQMERLGAGKRRANECARFHHLDVGLIAGHGQLRLQVIGDNAGRGQAGAHHVAPGERQRPPESGTGPTPATEMRCVAQVSLFPSYMPGAERQPACLCSRAACRLPVYSLTRRAPDAGGLRDPCTWSTLCAGASGAQVYGNNGRFRWRQHHRRRGKGAVGHAQNPGGQQRALFSVVLFSRGGRCRRESMLCHQQCRPGQLSGRLARLPRAGFGGPH